MRKRVTDPKDGFDTVLKLRSECLCYEFQTQREREDSYTTNRAVMQPIKSHVILRFLATPDGLDWERRWWLFCKFEQGSSPANNRRLASDSVFTVYVHS